MRPAKILIAMIAIGSCFIVLKQVHASFSTLPVDLLVSMNTSTPGAALTAPISTAGIVSSDCSSENCNFTYVNGSSADFEVGADQSSCANPGPVSLDGGSTVYSANSLNYNSIGHFDADNNTTIQLNLPNTITNLSLMGCLTLGPPPVVNTQDYDEMIIFGTDGDYATAQLNACTYSPGYGLRLESGHPTTHSASCIQLTPQSTYWVSMNYDIPTGNESLYVYTPQGTLVGSTTVSEEVVNGETFDTIYIGNNEAGNNSGTVTYFQNIMADWTNHTNPLFWSAANSSINSFSASPSIVSPAGTSTLSWNVENASSVAVTPGGVSTSTLVGSITVYPTSTTIYALTVTGGNSSSTATTTVTVDSSTPTTPTGLTATSISSSHINLSWTSSTDSGGSGVAGYNIFRCTGSSCTPTTFISTSSVTSYSDTALSASTAYTYAVSAYNGVGTISATSTTTTATTQSLAYPWSVILASSRATNWSQAGVAGGIPNRSNICATLTSSATTAQINTAITNCSTAGGGVVLLGAGTYGNATSGICFSGASNVTLRGAGANETILVPTSGADCHGFEGGSFGIGIDSADGNSNTSIANGPVAVSGTVSQDSALITLASVPNLKVGNPIILDQLDTVADNGGILVTQANTTQTGAVSPGNNGPYSLDGDAGSAMRCASASSPANCYSQEQIVLVASCNGNTTPGASCSGTNVSVGISPSLYMPNWSTSDSMSAWWSSSPALNDGVEDLTLDATNDPGAVGIELFNCANCWVKGDSIVTTSQSHVQLFYVVNASVVNNYMLLTQNAAPASYGVECLGASGSLVENNIFQSVTTPMISNGSCDGMVWGYNFAVNEYFTSSAGYNIPARGDHASGDSLNLSEGNITNGHTADVIHGTGNLNTDFRNYFTGTQPDCYASGSSYSTATYEACNNNLSPESILSYHRFYNLIGNVLGTTGVNTGYETGSFPVLSLGEGDEAVPNDPNVSGTIMLWGNADSATGFGSPRFNCGEVPTALTGIQAPFSNPCPSTDTLPASFYYSSEPSWWPSGKPWPAIGPDVTLGNVLTCTSGPYIGSLVTSATQCGGSASAVAGGHVNSIPAMDCYLSLGGLPNGTGPELSNFNENICYGSTDSGGTSFGSLLLAGILKLLGHLLFL